MNFTIKETGNFGLSRNVLVFPLGGFQSKNNERNESPMKKTSCQMTKSMIGLTNNNKGYTLWVK